MGLSGLSLLLLEVCKVRIATSGIFYPKEWSNTMISQLVQPSLVNYFCKNIKTPFIVDVWQVLKIALNIFTFAFTFCKSTLYKSLQVVVLNYFLFRHQKLSNNSIFQEL